MNIVILNPPAKNNKKYIREGRCMQLTSSWAAIWPPITLLILARIANDLAYMVSLIDSNIVPIKYDDIPTILDNVEIVVLNTSFPSIDSDLEIARLIKKVNPKIFIIGIGAYFILTGSEGFPKDRCIDCAIIGEPEVTFKELLINISCGQPNDTVNGLILYCEDGTLKETPKRNFISDLDSLPKPDRSLVNNKKYVLPTTGEPFTLINTSRGCPFSCTYCMVKAYYGQKVRRHSVVYILDEIEECVNKYLIKNFLLWEECFALNKQVVKNFCRGLIDRNLNIKWAVTTRADSIDKDTLLLMKKTGCFLIGMGIESSSQKILDRAKKQEKLEDINNGIQLCNEVGIPVMGHFIFGLPGETVETAINTIKFIKKSGITYLQSYCAVPYPGTEFGIIAKKNNWINTNQWSKYDFGGDSIVEMPEFSSRNASYFRRKAFRSFYYRPKKIFFELKNIKNITTIIQAMNFLKWIK